MSDIAINIEGISKKYSVGKEKDGSLRGTLNGLFKKNSAKSNDFWALKDISFDVKKGEVIGIIGKNGAGKSTLLKILSQITKPTEGRIEINGRVASLLEVGTGFHPELTGRENIFLNGTILGMSRKEVKLKFDEIVEFSGVQKFIDTPVKHYSSGMYVRLAFAVAAHLEPEILIIDEVLAVGDAEFQQKCLGKMQDVADKGRTVLFVSHNMVAVENLCNKSVLIENGKMKSFGTTKEIISRYLKNFKSESLNGVAISDIKQREGSGIVMIKDLKIKTNNNSNYINIGEGLTVNIEIENISQNLVEKIDIGLSIHNDGMLDKKSIFYSSYFNKLYSLDKGEKKSVVCKIPNINYSEGRYFIKSIITVNGEVSDWIIPPLTFFDTVFADYFKSGKGNKANKAPILLKAEWV